jgi:hypothetical protein
MKWVMTNEYSPIIIHNTQYFFLNILYLEGSNCETRCESIFAWLCLVNYLLRELGPTIVGQTCCFFYDLDKHVSDHSLRTYYYTIKYGYSLIYTCSSARHVFVSDINTYNYIELYYFFKLLLVSTCLCRVRYLCQCFIVVKKVNKSLLQIIGLNRYAFSFVWIDGM